MDCMEISEHGKIFSTSLQRRFKYRKCHATTEIPVDCFVFIILNCNFIVFYCRYDREIDKAERSAIKRILEKDDSAQKRIVLVVSDIFQVNTNT